MIYGGDDAGMSYEGSFLAGKRHGHGTMVWPSKQEYCGEWHQDIRQGFGRYCWPDESVFEGNWERGKREGHGVMTWHDGTKYEGEWKDDILITKSNTFKDLSKERSRVLLFK